MAAAPSLAMISSVSASCGRFRTSPSCHGSWVAGFRNTSRSDGSFRMRSVRPARIRARYPVTRCPRRQSSIVGSTSVRHSSRPYR
uniref:Putative secreted peptide n=1 Tax=Anopheles braziliensis TaxID=58242 RepID=A0A2M3ZR92_9DIPT